MGDCPLSVLFSSPGVRLEQAVFAGLLRAVGEVRDDTRAIGENTRLNEAVLREELEVERDQRCIRERGRDCLDLGWLGDEHGHEEIVPGARARSGTPLLDSPHSEGSI